MKHLFKTTQSEYEEICQSLAIPHVAHTLDTYNIEWESDKDIVPVEYLQSTGTQYIDTLIPPSSNFECEIKGQYTANQGSYDTLLGSYDGTNFGVAAAIDTSGKFYIQFGNGSSYAAQSSASNPLNLHTFNHSLKNGTLKCIVDNGTVFTKAFAGGLPSLSMYLFGRHTASGIGSYAKVKIHYCKIWSNDLLVRDFIPVRVGSTGYMFDRVSCKLFGNAGSGNFTPGPDIVPVEYLQSTGTQYINTGVYGYMNHTYEIDFNQTDTNNYRIWGVFGQQSYVGYNMSFTYGSSTWMVRWESTSNGQNNIGLGSINTQKHNIKISNGQIYFDNVNKGISTGHNSNSVINFNLFLFTINPANTTPSSNAKVRIYSYKDMDENGKLIRNLIPVRVDNVGYMYDKVSHKLFANAGTGNFTVGPDDPTRKLTRNC